MKKLINILHLEDDEKDALLIHEIINSELAFCKVKRVETKNEFEKALKEESYDLIISDFALPTYNGLDALKFAKELAPDIPYIYVSGHIGEERAIEALKLGATDYVLKDRPAKLVPAINRALREVEEKERIKAIESALKESERFSRSTLDSITYQLGVIDESGKVLFVNKAWENSAVKGSPIPQGLQEGENYLESCRGNAEALKFANGIMSVINGYSKEYMQEYPCPNGVDTKWFVGIANKFEDEGPVRVIISHADITERKLSAEKIENSERRYKALFEQNPGALLEYSAEGKLIAVNNKIEEITGYTIEEFKSRRLSDMLTEESKIEIENYYRLTLQGNSYNFNLRAIHKNGEHKIWNTTSIPIIINNKVEGLFGVLKDVTEEKLADEKIRRHNSQLETVITVEQSILSSSFDIDTITKMIIENAQSITQADGSAIGMIEAGEINFKVSSGIYKDFPPLRLKVNKSLSGVCYKTGEFIICQDTDKEERVDKNVCRKMGIRGLFIAPLNYNNKIIGILNLAYKTPNAIKEEYVSLMKLLLVFLASAMNLAEEFEANKKLTEEKTQALEMLKESEELYRNIFEAAPIGIARVSTEGTILTANLTLCEMLGYSKEEFKDKRIIDITHEDDKPKSSEYLRKTISQNSAITRFEKRYLSKSGETVWVNISSTSLCDKNGKILYLITMVENINKKKAAELALKESEMRFRDLADLLPQTIFEISGDFNLTYVNKAGLEIFGYTAEEFKSGLSIHDIPRCKDMSFILDRFNRVLDGEVFGGTEFTAIRKDGSNFPCIVYAARIMKDKTVTGIRGILIDITERKQATEKLEESEEKYRSLFEKNLAGVFMSTIEGKIISCNQAFANIYGYDSAEELYSIDAKNLYAGTEERDSFIKKLFIEKELKNCETKGKKKNGDEIWILENAELEYSDDNKTAYIFGTILEITERKKVEKEILNAKEKAEEMNRLKSNFLANMSHELRTPLIGIMGFSQILGAELKDEELKSMADTIHNSGNRLLETLNLILDLSRIEADKLDMVFLLFDGIESIKEIIKLSKVLADKKRLYLKLETELNRIKLNIDERIFTEIVENLINNAVKFTKKGGVVVMVEEELIAGDKWIVIKVNDTGIGIPHESINYIFDEFRQVSEGYSRSFEGAGLGLTITKKFVDKLGGKISVESQMGKGSTFTVKLPTNIKDENNNSGNNPNGLNKLGSPDSKVEINSGITAEEKTLQIKNEVINKLNIMLVEDDETTRHITGLYLKNKYILDSTAEGLDGIRMAKSKHFDIILMDINLGGDIDGLETARAIREIPGYEQTPIVAFTAYAMKGDRENFLSSGCTHYISKPFTKFQLLELLDEIVKTSV